MIWFDCHNHLQFSRLGDPAPLLAAMHSAGVERCVVNATCEAEWAAVAALARAYPESLIPAFGIHPNHAHLAGGPGQVLRLLSNLAWNHGIATIWKPRASACFSSLLSCFLRFWGVILNASVSS